MVAVYKRHDEVALRVIKAGATPHLQDKVNPQSIICSNSDNFFTQNKTNALLLAIGRSNEEKVVNSLLNGKPALDLQDSVSLKIISYHTGVLLPSSLAYI